MPKKSNANTKSKANTSNKPGPSGFVHSRPFYVLLVFALIFAGAGTYHIIQSHASSNLCVDGTYSIQQESQYLPCVQHLQYVIDNWRNTIYSDKINVGTYLQQDGYFGPQTKADVIDFQNYANLNVKRLQVDGIVGNNTWYWLCDAAASRQFGYDNVGCFREWSHTMQFPIPI